MTKLLLLMARKTDRLRVAEAQLYGALSRLHANPDLKDAQNRVSDLSLRVKKFGGDPEKVESLLRTAIEERQELVRRRGAGPNL